MEPDKVYSPAHTQILLFQYFKNDRDDPLAYKRSGIPREEAREEALKRLSKMVKSLSAVGFPEVELLAKSGEPRNYSYPQFEVREAQVKGLNSLSLALQEEIEKYLKSNQGAFQLADSPCVSAAHLITVRKDQKADHLNFNQFLALVVELPFTDLRSLRSFLERHNYEVLKNRFLNAKVWGEPNFNVSSMPTYVFVGSKNESPALGTWVMDNPVPVYNQHSPSAGKQSDVERGYPYVNYIVHERASGLIACEYDYVDLGLAVFLHGYLDRDTKKKLQEQADQLIELMDSNGWDEGGTEERLAKFRKTATEVAKISNNIPEIEMMGRRLTQKYSSPNRKLQTIFQMVDGDNREFLENSVRAVAQGTKVLQDLFLVDFEQQRQEFERRHEEYRGRIENFIKVISAFAIVVVLKEIWPRETAKEAVTTLKSFMMAHELHWPMVFVDHPEYFHSSFLVGAGLFAVIVLYLVLDDKWKPSWSKILTGGPILASVIVWFECGRPILGLLLALVVACLVAIFVGKRSLGSQGESAPRWDLFTAFASPFVASVFLPFYSFLIYRFGSSL